MDSRQRTQDLSRPESAQSRLPLVLLAVLLLATAAFRLPILSDDRTWVDENAILLQGHALSLGRPWPAVFEQKEVLGQVSLVDVLATVKEGPYPPAMPVTVFAFRGTPDPVHRLRVFLFGVGLTMLVVVYVTARMAGGSWFALLAATYVAISPILTHSIQQIKWVALGAPVALFAGALLLRRERHSGRGIQATYVLTLCLLLHLHYFCVWVIPGHLIYTFLAERDRLAQRIKEAAVAVGAAAPWLVWALPTQLAYVRGVVWARISAQPPTAWNAPFDLASATRGLGYDALVALGVLPLPLQARWLFPILLIATYCLTLALRSALPGRRRLALLAVSCLGTAAVAQTLYAFRVGNVVPLQPLYLSPWVPLLVIGVLAGAMEVKSPALRAAVMTVLLGSSASALVLNPTLKWIVESPLPRDYRGLCRTLNSGDKGAVVYQSDLLAKLVNIACPIEGVQAIGVEGMRSLPVTVPSIRTLTSCGATLGAPRGWIATADAGCTANARLGNYTRAP